MGLSLNIGTFMLLLYCLTIIYMLCILFNNDVSFSIIDMASAAFIEALPVIEFVAQLLGKDVLSRPLSDSDRIKVGLRSI